MTHILAKILRTVAPALAAVPLLLLAAPATAQEVVVADPAEDAATPVERIEVKQGAFTTDESARCAFIYAYAADAMRGMRGAPREQVRRMNDGIHIWEFELAASDPSASEEELRSAANRAIGYVRMDMPNGEGSEGAKARGNFLMAEARSCEDKIVAVYGNQLHPVIPFLRADEFAVREESPATRTTEPASALSISGGERDDGGLR